MYFLIKISMCERKICIANLIDKLRSNTRHFDFAKGDAGIPRGNWNWSNDLRIRSGRQGSWTLKGVGKPRKDGTVIPSSSICSFLIPPPSPPSSSSPTSASSLTITRARVHSRALARPKGNTVWSPRPRHRGEDKRKSRGVRRPWRYDSNRKNGFD